MYFTEEGTEMRRALIFLSFWACSYAQLVYPDQYERMKTSTVPPYVYTTNGRVSRVQPAIYRNTGFAAAQLPSNYTEQEYVVQYASPLAASAVGSAYPSTYSTVQAEYSPTSTIDWREHVNNIITNGVTKFALDMDREVYRTQVTSQSPFRENIIFSPLSLVATLAMVLLGSAGRTFDEVAKVLGLESGVDISRHSEVVHQLFGLLLNQIEDNIVGSMGPRTNFASAVFVQDGYSIRPEFKAVSENVYRSEVINLNFYGKPKEAQDVVNTWVKQRTMEKISSILSEAPGRDTKVILISALYFNGEWNQHFMESATRRRPFFIEPNEAIDVDMMFNGGVFKFHEDKRLGVKIVRLPYKGLDTAMYVLLPKAQGATALRNFENQLTTETLESLISNMKNETCIIGLPRMKLSSTLSLHRTLRSLGLNSLFDPSTADLSLLSQGYSNPLMSSPQTAESPAATIPTVAPLPMTSSPRPGKSGSPVSHLTSNNDLFIFPRFGDDEGGDGTRRNFFSYEDKVRGLTVQQWATGFSISRNRRFRRDARRRARREELPERDINNKEREHSYTIDEAEPSPDKTKIVNLEENKYRFKNSPAAQAMRRKRQTRPINQDVLNYIRSLNLPSYGLDEVRNSATLVNPGLYADDVLHKVEIDITERGTEAAAVTSVILERDGNQKRLVANRPFIFFIRHDPTKFVLFWGTVNTPTPNYRVT